MGLSSAPLHFTISSFCPSLQINLQKKILHYYRYLSAYR
jgi:hypothetical protein